MLTRPSGLTRQGYLPWWQPDAGASSRGQQTTIRCSGTISALHPFHALASHWETVILLNFARLRMLYSAEPGYRNVSVFSDRIRTDSLGPSRKRISKGPVQTNSKDAICIMGRRLKTILYKLSVRSRCTVQPRCARLRSVRPALAFLLLLVGVAVSAPAAHAQSASTWNKRGQAAEAREDYDVAYQDYQKARLKAPDNLWYKTRYENSRFKAAAAHVDRGRIYLQGGDADGAVAEFQRALEIDPSNQTAQQEIDQIRSTRFGGAAPPAAHAAQQLPNQAESRRDIASLEGITQLKPVSNDPITIHSVEDSKYIYQAIGKIAGLNVLFDPDYTSKRIPVDLNNVSLSDALRIVGTISGTFYKPVTSNTIFVAANTRQKRTDLEELAVQTFYLTNMSTANDATEVLTAIRNMMDPTVKIFLVPSQNALVMRGTPDQLMLAEKLINDLDRAKPEVVVDVAVLEVNKTLERTLGITLPQSFGLTAQAPNTTSTTTSSTTGTTTTPTTTTSNLTLNNLAHLNGTDFAVTLGGATVNALLTNADTRILQNPRIRASDGQRATLKIGSKIPVATGSYSAGAATGLTAGIGVQTQFTYIDVGVNIDMTPTVHYDHEITLKVKVEVSSQSSVVTISGVTEPVISQRVADQVIQLQDGEPSILAGINTKSESLGISGTPGIAEMPILKYIFASRDRNTSDDEIVFLIIPHIVRESILTKLNTRAIDTGTSQSMELRHDPTLTEASDMEPADVLHPAPEPAAAVPVDAASAAAAAVHSSQFGQPVPGQIPPPVPGQLPSPATAPPPAAGPPVSFSVQPSNPNPTVGSTFTTSVVIGNAQDVFAVPLQLQFNPAVLQLVNVDSGPFLGSDSQAVALAHRVDNGTVTISASRPPNTKGMSGQGSVCNITFKAIAPGDSTLNLVKVGAMNSAHANLPAVGSQAVVHVK
jgi:general secretion pathway protein D